MANMCKVIIHPAGVIDGCIIPDSPAGVTLTNGNRVGAHLTHGKSYA